MKSQLSIFYLIFMLICTYSSAQTTFYEHYEKGLILMQKSDWNAAINQFNLALSKVQKDESRKKTYGVQFIEYYPNREIGIAYFNLQNYDLAKKHLALSLQQSNSSRALEYIIKIDPSYTINNKIDPIIQPEKKEVATSNKIAPPLLVLTDIKFTDKNGNNRIDGNEDCAISFNIVNKGGGTARNVKVFLQNISNISGLSFTNPATISSISPNKVFAVNIPLRSSTNLTTGIATLKVGFEEQLGFPPDQFELNIETREHVNPNIKVVDNSFFTEFGTIKLGMQIQLKALIQNVGQGTADNVKVRFIYPSSNIFPFGQEVFEIGTMNAGDTKEIVFEFIANKLYTSNTIPITINVSEKLGKFGESKEAIAYLNTNSSGTTINIASNTNDKIVNIQVASLTSDVDKNIPFNITKHPNRYALIIGNEDYSSRQTGISTEVNVAFAVNDANIFKMYTINTMGIDEKNVFFITNATSGEMQQKIDLVSQILTRLGSRGELIFFYAGHGFPDEVTKEPYLIPVDVNATNLLSAVKLNDVYKKFSKTGANRITIFLDACFTGGGRESGLLAARGVKVKPKEGIVSGNVVIFTATSEDQSALPYKEKQHGMFTYFLLKKLQETKGNLNYGELDNYLKMNVSVESLRINSKAQDPKVNVSQEAINEWETWKLY